MIGTAAIKEYSAATSRRAPISGPTRVSSWPLATAPKAQRRLRIGFDRYHASSALKKTLATSPTDTGTLYLHLDYRESHYAKVLLDALFGREAFLNEIIWAYDYGARSKSRWPAKHDTILVYVKNPKTYYFDSSAVDREPYMAPGLVTKEKAELGKLPTDVWWHTIVSPTGKEKTGYPTQKPEGILRRIISASSKPGDMVLDFFAGSGTTGAVAHKLERNFVLIDQHSESIQTIIKRLTEIGAEFEQG